MRNLFDQYQHPENRLSHALAVCLHEDRILLRRFLQWLGIEESTAGSDLEISEQQLPGDRPVTEDEAERNGLPDIVIHDGDSWCLLVESKVQARVTEDQLVRHKRTLLRRGFKQVLPVLLTKAGAQVPGGTVAATWSGIYEWLGSAGQGSEWAERLRSYLRVAETRLARDGYLTEGTLTMFDGFSFSSENPYTYGEAKRLLKLALDELRKNQALIELGIDPAAPGRTSIKGQGGTYVWDFLSLLDRPPQSSHTKYPHLTMALHVDHLEVAITIPNGVINPVSERLGKLGVAGFVTLNAGILRRGADLLARGATISAYALHRHYLSQSSPPITDGSLSFRIETSQPSGVGKVKPLPERGI